MIKQVIGFLNWIFLGIFMVFSSLTIQQLVFLRYTLLDNENSLGIMGLKLDSLVNELFLYFGLTIGGALAFLLYQTVMKNRDRRYYEASDFEKKVSNVKTNTAEENATTREKNLQKARQELEEILPSSEVSHEMLLSGLAKFLEAGQGIVYTKNEHGHWDYETGYAFVKGSFDRQLTFEDGEGIVGQTGKTGESLFLDQLPEDYMILVSGLGSSRPNWLLILAVKNQNKEVIAVVELAGFGQFNKIKHQAVEEKILGISLHQESKVG